MARSRRTRKSPAPAAARADQPDRLFHSPEARRPLPSLIFLSPFLAFYAVGVFFVRPDLAARGDLLVRQLTEPLGLTGVLAPTYIVVGLLVLWHFLRGDPTRVSRALLGQMAAETVLLVIPIFALKALVAMLAHGGFVLQISAVHGAAPGGWLGILLSSIGAGIYEELLFRLLLVGVPLWIARKALAVESTGLKIAVVLIAAGIFAGAHTLDDPRAFAWDSFLFRAGAGTYLGYVFAQRGFGIVVGVHMVYDLVIEIARMA
jgi:hypothetical protein